MAGRTGLLTEIRAASEMRFGEVYSLLDVEYTLLNGREAAV